MVEIELVTGNIIKGDLKHFGHQHPKDEENHAKRKNWHYYVEQKTGTIHHLRKEHIVRVSELKGNRDGM